MFDLPGPFSTLANFLVIAFGFGFIIFIHELGHFVAAKWAGIRVLAFSIGFGNVLCSYRKGIGFRRGSSDLEYRKLVYGSPESDDPSANPEISPTEYRLSMLPLGGYVKMLGQEDLNPDAVSDAPDSYQNCPATKRMVVISAGVIMNIITAAALFILVFMVGLKVLPPIAGFVPSDSPAALATPINHPELGVGIQRGDTILSIDGHHINSYEAILPEVAMSKQAKPVTVALKRDGVDGIIEFEAIPEKSPQSGLLDIGLMPAMSTTLLNPRDPDALRQWRMLSHDFGMAELEPGDVFVSANQHPINSPFDLLDIAKQTPGAPLNIIVERAGEQINFLMPQVPSLQVDRVKAYGESSPIANILGLTGVLMVHPFADPEDVKQGLMPGDIFARIANTEYPTVPEGISIIQANRGQDLDLLVLRIDESGTLAKIKLTVKVESNGRVGFLSSSTTTHSNIVAEPPSFVRPVANQESSESDSAEKSETVVPPAAALIEYPGSRITLVGNTPISTLRDVHTALVNATTDAFDAGDESFSVPVTIELPLPIQPDGSVPTTTADWTLSRADIEQVRSLGSTLPGSTGIVTMFEYAQIVDKADGPIAAIARGVSESRRAMLQTYLTFLRLFEGSVEVKQLKGPVGIAHIGTQIASQGWVKVLFFMALISINLAVINFLPLPIVDGGQFLMLVYEWIRGRPVPVLVQNVATMAGLLLIGTIFLYVTFNDVKAVFGV